jgi:hypothetical protein
MLLVPPSLGSELEATIGLLNVCEPCSSSAGLTSQVAIIGGGQPGWPQLLLAAFTSAAGVLVALLPYFNDNQMRRYPSAAEHAKVRCSSWSGAQKLAPPGDKAGSTGGANGFKLLHVNAFERNLSAWR